MTTVGYFADLDDEALDQQDSQFGLICHESDMPTDHLILFEVADEHTGVKQAKSGREYVNCAARVVEPQALVDRIVWFGISPQSQDKNTGEVGPSLFAAQIVAAIAGKPFSKSYGGDAEEASNTICEGIVGKRFVGKVGVRKSEEYGDKDVIRTFLPAATWGTTAKKKGSAL